MVRFIMSFATHLNGSMPLSDHWSDYLAHAQANLPPLNSRFAIIAVLNIPLIVIILNALAQLIPRRASEPPVVFHWLPIIGSAISYGNDPLNFFFKCQKKYGDVFTFILFGRRVTVALGPRGNNFILLSFSHRPF